MAPERSTNGVIEAGDSRYYRESRQFFASIFQDSEACQNWSVEMQKKLEEDFLIAGYDRGIRVPYASEDFLTAGILYLRDGRTAQSISQQYPDIPVFEAINTIRDLAILSFPENASACNLGAENCKRRSKRILGIEPRTTYQERYANIFDDNPQLMNNESELVTKWKSYLLESSTPSFNVGNTIDYEPETLIEMTRMLCKKGYSFNMATDLLEIKSISKPFVRRILYLSLLTLHEVLEEESSDSKPVFEIDDAMKEHKSSADELSALKKEREEISSVVDFHKQIYSGKSEEKPYLNPLQVAILDSYQRKSNFNAISKEFPFLDRNNLSIKTTSLRNIVSGYKPNGVSPYATEFQNALRGQITGDPEALDAIFKSLEVQKPELNIEATINQIITETGGVALKLTPQQILEAMGMRKNGDNIRTIARYFNVGKNIIFDILNRVESEVIADYFPQIVPVRDAILGKGRKLIEFIKSCDLFNMEELDSFSEEQVQAWNLVRRRRSGVKAQQLIDEGLSEIRVSELSELAVITAIRYEKDLLAQQHIQVENKEPKGKAFSVSVDSDQKHIVIDRNVISPSHREFVLFNLLQQKRKLTFEEGYSALYPEDVYHGTNRQREDLRVIVHHLCQRLGEDVREEQLIISNSSADFISLNPARFSTEDGNLRIYYEHSPFGSVANFDVDGGILNIEYSDAGHNRQVKISRLETRALNILLHQSSSGWMSIRSLAEGVFRERKDDGKMLRIGDIVGGLKRSLCVSYPNPGHILSDNLGNLRIITYQDYLSKRYYFKSKEGLFYLNANTFAVIDDATEKTVLRLGTGEARNFIAMCLGTDTVVPTVKWLIKQKLIEGKIISRKGVWNRLESDIKFIGEGDEGDWHNRIKILNSEPPYLVKVFRKDGKVIEASLTDGELNHFMEDPLNPLNFTDKKTGTLPDLDAFDEFDDNVRRALLEAGEYPLLNIAGEHILLIRMIAGDRDARERIFRSNMRLSFKEAKRVCTLFGNFNIFLDVLQESYWQLNNALDKFDIRRKKDGEMLKFSTYATWWARLGANRYLRNNGKTIRIPIHQQEFATVVYKLKKALRNSGEVTSPEILAFNLLESSDQNAIDSFDVPLTGIEEDKTLPEAIRKRFLSMRSRVLKVLQTPTTISFDAEKNEDDERSLSDQFADPDAITDEQAEEKVSDGLNTELVERLLSQLNNPRDAEMLKYKYGIIDGKPHTMEETGKHFGVTRERVRQIESKAIEKMRGYQSDEETRRLIRGYKEE